MIALEPVGVVVGGRAEAVDDDWGCVDAVIRMDATRFGPDAVVGLDGFSHVVVVFQFHLVDETEVQGGGRAGPAATPPGRRSVCSPRGPRCAPTVSASPPVPSVAWRGSTCTCRGLDAVDGSPVLDVKPYMREFEPDDGDVRQPTWATELMRGYY